MKRRTSRVNATAALSSMKIFQSLWKTLLCCGWLLFWLSLLLPMNTSLGGLTDAGKPYYGFLNLYYSIISIVILPMLIFDYQGASFALYTFLKAGLGICNLLMMFGIPILLFTNRVNKFARLVGVSCAVYVCIIGTIDSWHFYPIRYGHYVWCLSFVIMAFALTQKVNNKDALS